MLEISTYLDRNFAFLAREELIFLQSNQPLWEKVTSVVTPIFLLIIIYLGIKEFLNKLVCCANNLFIVKSTESLTFLVPKAGQEGCQNYSLELDEEIDKEETKIDPIHVVNLSEVFAIQKSPIELVYKNILGLEVNFTYIKSILSYASNKDISLSLLVLITLLHQSERGAPREKEFVSYCKQNFDLKAFAGEKECTGNFRKMASHLFARLAQLLELYLKKYHPGSIRTGSISPEYLLAFFDYSLKELESSP